MALDKIGQRRAEESGTFLIGGGDNVGTIKIRDLAFEIRILLSQDPPTAKYSTPDKKTGIFTFVGAIGHSGNTWIYNNVAKFGDQPIGVIFRVQTVGTPIGVDPIFCVTYTFVYKNAVPQIEEAA